ncbi:MAG TPA: ABC transporter substrate-binding protein [Beijerinckiaceae bacterium]|jgi:NitT/TauT family transport system substrate-binding protein
MKLARILTIGLALAGVTTAASAQTTLKVALPQKGNWDTGITEFGVKAGFFKEAGLDIDVLYTQGGAQTVQAVLAGSVDLAMQGGILGLVGAYVKNAPIRIVAPAMTGTPDVFWYARADSGIKSFKDVDGKTVAFSAPGSSTNLILLSLFDHYKVKGRATPTGGIPGTFTQVMSKQIDVGWSVPPFGLKEMAEKQLVIVARGNEVPALQSQTVRVNFTTADTLAKKRDALVKFQQVYNKTLEWAYKDPKAIEFFAEAAGVSQEVARETRDGFYPKESLQPYEVKDLQQTLDQALSFKFIPKAMKPEEVKGMIDILVPGPKG